MITTSLRYRQVIADIRRVVVKIGTRVLVQKTGRPDIRSMKRLARELAEQHHRGLEIVIITSGAIGAGMEALGMKERPKDLPDLQMAAAIGQCRLMARYDKLFGEMGCKVGQILLTHADFKQTMRLTNIRRTMENLLRHRVIPVINENDVVSDEEIKADLSFGDNDYLAALVVKVIRADLLILLTTVDGVRRQNENGQSQRIRYLETITPETFKLVHASDSA
ncbi:MAG: glutamate 5-kinase, partial [Kiritimatiellae bacterium]|nr:glutamate 5-kinase [Kiritimatiellia bacterium]